MRPPPCDAESAPLAQAFRRLVMRIGVEADDRAAVPGRIFLRVLHHPASIPVARETAAARTAYARQAHPRLRRDTAMPRRRIPRAGHFNIMLARISPSSSSTIISPCGHGALRYSDRRVYAQFPMGIASMLLLVSQQVLVGRGDRRDIRRCCLSYHAISSFSNPGEP